MKKTWTVDLPNRPHTVELERGTFSGKHTIRVDGQVVEQWRPSAFILGGDHAFEIGTQAAVLHTRTNGITYNYDLSINGRSVESGREIEPLAPMPRWAWIFFVACAAIPVVTLGGALPTGIGIGAAFLCMAIARDQSRAVGLRIGISVVVVIASWVLVFGVVGAVAGLFGRGAASSVSTDWRIFTSDTGRFSVSMPGALKEDRQTLDTDIGPLDYHSFLYESLTDAYLVGYSDYPDWVVRQVDPDLVLEGGRDGAVSNVGGTLTSERTISLDGNPGLEFQADVEVPVGNRSVPGVFHARVYLVGERLYYLIVVTTTEDAFSADVLRFLDSFTLLSQ